MNDFISRQALIAEFKEKCNGECGCCEYNGSDSDTGENCRLIVETPAADVQPVKRGKWKRVALILNRSVCSNCSWRTDEIDTFDFNFCPNCGAKMEEE